MCGSVLRPGFSEGTLQLGFKRVSPKVYQYQFPLRCEENDVIGPDTMYLVMPSSR